MPKFLEVTDTEAARSALGVTQVVDVLNHGVSGDGSTNDTAAIQAVVDDYAGIKPIYFPPGRYRMGSSGGSGANRVTLPSGSALLFAEGAVVEVNQIDNQSGTALFYATGSDGTKTSLTANATAGSQTVALPTGGGAGFAVGDIIGLESAGSAGTYSGGDWFVRELHTVTSVSSDTVTIDFPLEFSYLTSDSAVFWKMTPAEDILIDGAVFEPGAGVTPGTSGTYAIRVDKGKNVRIRNVQLRNMIGGILLSDVYGAHVTDCRIDGLPKVSDSYGYGVTAVGGSTKITIDNLHGANTRHLFTTLADQRSTTYWGGPLHVKVNNGIGYGSPAGYSIWDTHEFGRHIEFNGCSAFGGGAAVSGFQVRAQDVTIADCVAQRNGLRGVVAASTSARLTVRGGRFGYAGSQGISLTGTDNRVVGAYVHDCTGAGINVTSSSIRPQIQDCWIVNNNYGIQDAGASGSVDLRVSGCLIPYSTDQNYSFLNLSATAVIDTTQCLGFSGTGIQNPESGAQWSVLTTAGLVSNAPVSSLDLGNADTTITRASAGVVAVEGVNIARTTDVQSFTTSGTWTKPANAVSVRVRCIGPGGGGGSGARGPSGTALSGGGGGSGGGMCEMMFAASDLPSTVSVTVNTGGAGGSAQSVDDTAGNGGNNPAGHTSFGTYLHAGRGNGGGGGGLASAGSAGSTSGSGWGTGMQTGGAGGAGSATGAAGATGGSATATGGGGGGGGITAAAAANAGGAGGKSFSNNEAGGTSGSGANGGAGSSSVVKGAGSGGGGGGANVSGAGYNGGAGGDYGAGGGGGGAALNGSASGAGGKGGDGICIVTTYF